MNMASTSLTRLGLLAALLLGAVALNGCMFLDAQFTMLADGGQDAMMEVGILKQMAEGEGAEGELDIGAEAVAEENWEEPVEFDRGEWQVTMLKGHADAGDSLFKDDAEAQPEFAMVGHRFTTVYQFTMVMEGAPVMEPVADAPAEGDVEVEVEGMEGMNEAFEGLAEAVMGSGRPLRFSCSLPGKIVSGNGEAIAPDTMQWAMGLSGEGVPEDQTLRASSRLINWEVIGAVGSAMVEAGRHDLVLPMISAAQRGVIPDPLTDEPLGGEFDFPLYQQILDIMVTLDGLVGEEMADRVMIGLALNADAPDAALVTRVYERISADEYAVGMRDGLTAGLIGSLSAE